MTAHHCFLPLQCEQIFVGDYEEPRLSAQPRHCHLRQIDTLPSIGSRVFFLPAISTVSNDDNKIIDFHIHIATN